jgi:uncharacterized protein YkwD
MKRFAFLSFFIFSTFFTITAPAQAGTCIPEPGWPPDNSAQSAEVLRLVNEHRATLGLMSLTPSVSLEKAADWKAQDMAVRAYLSHSDTDGRSFFTRVADCGYAYPSVGENIAFGYQSPQSVVTAWLNSPGHRANIEHGGFLATGLGSVQNTNGTWYWAQVFGSTLEDLPPPVMPPACPPPTSGAVAGGWPVPVPKWYWPWERYRLGLLAVRPSSAPTRIPSWAWRRLSATISYRRCLGR